MDARGSKPSNNAHCLLQEQPQCEALLARLFMEKFNAAKHTDAGASRKHTDAGASRLNDGETTLVAGFLCTRTADPGDLIQL
eukprot:1162132-Pelagomonas_calceolata.AAC.10